MRVNPHGSAGQEGPQIPTLEEQIDQVHYGCWTWDWAGWKVAPKVFLMKCKARSIEASLKGGKSNIGCVSSSSGFLSYRVGSAHPKSAPTYHGPSRKRIQASVVYLLRWKLMIWMLILSSYVGEELYGILQPHSKTKSKTAQVSSVDIPSVKN